PFLPYSGNKGLALRWEIGYAELRFAPVPRSARNDGGRGRRRNGGMGGTARRRWGVCGVEINLISTSFS
ncbi:MAG: hypothetical protein LBB79_08160, partial [Prevotellaceae bacterium]|nr:hypothetical protein [Prevotellaceae bacterium]